MDARLFHPFPAMHASRLPPSPLQPPFYYRDRSSLTKMTTQTRVRHAPMPLLIYFLLFIPLSWLANENPVIFIFPFAYVLSRLGYALYIDYLEESRRDNDYIMDKLDGMEQKLDSLGDALLRKIALAARHNTSSDTLSAARQRYSGSIRKANTPVEEMFAGRKRGAGQMREPPSPALDVPFEKRAREHSDMTVPVVDRLSIPDDYPTLADELSDSTEDDDYVYEFDLPDPPRWSKSPPKKGRSRSCDETSTLAVEAASHLLQIQTSNNSGPVAAMKPLSRLRDGHKSTRMESFFPEGTTEYQNMLVRLNGMTSTMLDLKSSFDSLAERLLPIIDSGRIETHVHNLEQLAYMINEQSNGFLSNRQFLQEVADSLHDIRSRVDEMQNDQQSGERRTLVELSNTLQIAISNLLDLLVGPNHNTQSSLPERFRQITRDLGFIKSALVEDDFSDSGSNASSEFNHADSSTIPAVNEVLTDDDDIPEEARYDLNFLAPLHEQDEVPCRRRRSHENEYDSESEEGEEEDETEEDDVRPRMVARPNTPEPGSSRLGKASDRGVVPARTPPEQQFMETIEEVSSGDEADGEGLGEGVEEDPDGGDVLQGSE